MGVAFSHIKGASNVGYIVPHCVVQHFMNEYRTHGRFRGVPLPGEACRRRFVSDLQGSNARRDRAARGAASMRGTPDGDTAALLEGRGRFRVAESQQRSAVRWAEMAVRFEQQSVDLAAVETQKLENDRMRSWLGMPDGSGGVMVRKVVPLSMTSKVMLDAVGLLTEPDCRSV